MNVISRNFTGVVHLILDRNALERMGTPSPFPPRRPTRRASIDSGNERGGAQGVCRKGAASGKVQQRGTFKSDLLPDRSGHLGRNVPVPEFPLLRDQISLWPPRLNDRPSLNHDNLSRWFALRRRAAVAA
jgi:hypothetical protein